MRGGKAINEGEPGKRARRKKLFFPMKSPTKRATKVPTAAPNEDELDETRTFVKPGFGLPLLIAEWPIFLVLPVILFISLWWHKPNVPAIRRQ